MFTHNNIRDICAYLDPRSVRALACASRYVRDVLRPLMGVTMTEFRDRTDEKLTVTYINKSWMGLNMVIETSMRLTSDGCSFEPEVITDDYTGLIHIEYLGNDYYMYSRAGYVCSDLWKYREGGRNMYIRTIMQGIHFTKYIRWLPLSNLFMSPNVKCIHIITDARDFVVYQIYCETPRGELMRSERFIAAMQNITARR